MKRDSVPPAVIDFEAPSSKRVLAELENKDVKKKVFKAATWYTSCDADAEDLFSDALGCVCDPEGQPWDPSRGSLAAHMRIVMRDLAKQERRRARSWREVTESRLAFDADAPDPRPQPDQLLSDARERARFENLGGMLRERISHNAFTRQVFDYRCVQGIDEPSEIARLIGRGVHEVYDANRQISYHADKILAEERRAEEARMKKLREQAKSKRATEKEVP